MTIGTRRGAIGVLLAILAIGCDAERFVVQAPGSQAEPAVAGDTVERTSALIADQANGFGTTGFTWIPPMVASAPPGFTTLDQTQTGSGSLLSLRIDRVYADQASDPTPKATFPGTAISMVLGLGGGFPGVTRPFYGVTWAPGATVAAGQSYRVRVEAQTTPVRVLGVADVQVVANAAEAGAVDRAKATPLIAGNTLAIVFRIENKDSDGDTVNDWRDNCPFSKNVTQVDSDGNGSGDECQCLGAANGTPCTTPCGTGQTCTSGTCGGGTSVANGSTCKTGNPCKQSETCTAGVCGGTNRSPGTACQTGNPCRLGGTCASGICSGSARPAGTACVSGNPCRTGETCNASGTCTGGTGKPVGTPCSTKSNPCRTGEVCVAGGTCGNTAVDKPNGTPCGAAGGRGNLCTGPGTCQAGACTTGAALSCTANACHAAGSCDPATGLCPPVLANGASCSDGDACNGAETCLAGACQAGTPIPCDASCTSFNGRTWCTGLMIENPSQGGTNATIIQGSTVTLSTRGFGIPPVEDSPGIPRNDSARFFYTQVTGDVEIVARVAASSPEGQAGVMIREDLQQRGAMGAGWLSWQLVDPMQCQDTGALSIFAGAGREQAGGQVTTISPNFHTRSAPPVWLRLQRIGDDYVVARSSDDRRTWVPIAGGAVKADTVLIGVYAGGQWTAQMDASATFDHVHVASPPQLDYRTTWIGSSFAAQSTGFVSRGAAGFYLAPDGTSYKQAWLPMEGGRNINRIESTTDPLGNQSARLLNIPAANNIVRGAEMGGISGEGTDVYVSTRQNILPCAPGTAVMRKTLDLAPVTAAPLPFGSPPLGLTAGLAVRNGKVYVSDVAVSEQVDPDAHPATPFCPYPPVLTRPSLVRIVDANNPAAAEVQFPYDRPGPLAVDDADRIWIIRSATPYPPQRQETCRTATGAFKPCLQWQSRYPGAFSPDLPGQIDCFKRVVPPPPPGTTSPYVPCTLANGSLTPAITAAQLGYTAGVAFNPTGVTIDRGANQTDVADDRLLITDNGPRQNALICTNLGGQRSCTTFGVPFGVFAGPTPGMVQDAASGAMPRLFSPIAAAADQSGDVFVASSAPRVDVRKFTPSGTPRWGVYGLGFELGGFDPDPLNDAHDFFTLTRHLTFDPTRTAPGSEWGSKSVTWNPFATYPDLKRLAEDPLTETPLIRRINGQRYMFISGPDDYLLQIFRFQGEIAVPYGAIEWVAATPTTPAALKLWMDSPAALNGIRDEAAGETSDTLGNSPGPHTGFSYDVDQDGNIWLHFHGPDGAGVSIWELHRNLTPQGLPKYGLSVGDGQRIPYAVPGPYQAQAVGRGRFDAAGSSGNGVMYIMGSTPLTVPESPNCNPLKCPCGAPRPTVFRYNNWRTTRTLADGYPVPLPDPRYSQSEPDDFMGRHLDPLCNGCTDWGYMGFDVAGDMFFAAERSGQIHVHDTTTGKEAIRLFPGPELSGPNWYWTDKQQHMQALKRANGEYLVTNTDYAGSSQARTIVYRWTPTWSPAALSPAGWYVASPTDVVQSGQGVSEWTDRSGNGRHVMQSAPSYQPQLVTNGWNGNKPAMSFDGHHFFRRDGWTGSPAGNESAFTVLAVLKSTANQESGIAAWWNMERYDHLWTRLTPTGAAAVTRNDDINGQQVLTTPPSSVGTERHVVVWRYSAGDLRIMVDGTPTFSSQTPIRPLTLETFLIGANSYWPTDMFRGQIAELVVVPSSLSDLDIGKFRTYAQQKWQGLP